MLPYVSFIMFARNDSYGHLGTARLQHSIDTLLQQLHDFDLASEIVLVEWNPPADTPALEKALRFPSQSDVVSVRVVSVPAQHHRRYRGHARKGMHVAAAFNVGMRRARADFVLPKPSDVYYTDEVIAHIAARNLETGTIYRVDRYDVDSSAVAEMEGDRRRFFEQCSAHVVHHHAPLDMPDYFDIKSLHTNACGDFSLMSRDLWMQVRGWYEGSTVASLDVDSLALHGAAACGAKEAIWADPSRVYKLTHGAVTIHRVRQVFQPYQRWLEWFTARALSGRGQNRVRAILDFPRRIVEGLPGTHMSFERNFLRRAQLWARGSGHAYLNPPGWGLAYSSLDEKYLLKAIWEDGVGCA